MDTRKDAARRLRYFNFLYRMVCNPSPNDAEYYYLLRHLHRTEFYSLVDFDDNRAEDGKRLRDIFSDNEGYTSPLFYVDDLEGCSVLEMMIGVAIRMEEILVGEPFEKTISECFWLMMENLGLITYDDYEYFCHPRQEIDSILLRLVERRYKFDGEGGLFPLRSRKVDQRKVEIWYQMNEYLLENYEF